MKAPRWLTKSFADGVDARMPGGIRLRPPYPGAYPACFLSRHDPLKRPCIGPIERFHFIPRQRVENALWPLLREAVIDEPDGGGGTFRAPLLKAEVDELVLLAAWDSRNGGHGCEGHHRRFDRHLTPAIDVRYEHLPAHVVRFAFDWGIDGQLGRFPSEI